MPKAGTADKSRIWLSSDTFVPLPTPTRGRRMPARKSPEGRRGQPARQAPRQHQRTSHAAESYRPHSYLAAESLLRHCSIALLGHGRTRRPISAHLSHFHPTRHRKIRDPDLTKNTRPNHAESVARV